MWGFLGTTAFLLNFACAYVTGTRLFMRRPGGFINLCAFACHVSVTFLAILKGANTLDRPVVPLHMLLQKEDLHLAHTSGVFVSTVSLFLIDSRKVCTTLKQEMYGSQNHNLPLPSWNREMKEHTDMGEVYRMVGFKKCAVASGSSQHIFSEIPNYARRKQTRTQNGVTYYKCVFVLFHDTVPVIITFYLFRNLDTITNLVVTRSCYFLHVFLLH